MDITICIIIAMIWTAVVIAPVQKVIISVEEISSILKIITGFTSERRL